MHVYIQIQRVNDALKVEHGEFSIDLIRTDPKLIIYLGDAVGLCINVCMTVLFRAYLLAKQNKGINRVWQMKIFRILALS